MRRMILLVTVVACALMPLSCSYPKADLVLQNGAVYTMESDLPWARAVAVSGNRILAVLDSDDVAERYVGPNTQVIDLGGRFVVPGFVDGHT
ncbi:MAG: amidohydrolase, partial [Acidobacteria bacterium]|nr:amidohydrolase [Acidobacteriota bacterium]